MEGGSGPPVPSRSAHGTILVKHTYDIVNILNVYIVVKHVIFLASKFVYFKRQTYRRKIILVDSNLMTLNVIFSSHRGYF